MSDSEGYILNAVQTPGPLIPVYRSINRGNTTKEKIRLDTGIDNNLDATVKGLRLLRLVGREDEEYYAEPFHWDVSDTLTGFRLTALHNLAQECVPGDWGKQAVVLLNYRYLLDENIQYFENNDETLFDEKYDDSIDSWFEEVGYEPRSQQGRITHNEQKFGNWTRLIKYLGLVHKVSGREHTVYPDSRLVLKSVELAANERGEVTDGTPTIEIGVYLRWLRENLLYVNTTSDGDIPAPLARVLFELMRDGHIEAREYGDAGSIGFSGVPPHDRIDRNANTLRVH
jgi:hypothetical protein